MNREGYNHIKLKLRPLRRLFNSTFNKSSYYISKDYYFITTNKKYVDDKYLTDLIYDQNVECTLKSSESIKFKGIIDFGLDEKSVELLLGYPVNRFACKKADSHYILYYKWYIGNYKVNVEMHFYDQVFIMGVLNFGLLKFESDKQFILNILTDKYNTLPINQSCHDVVIIDNDSNYIKINDDMGLSITYMTGDASLLAPIHLHHKKLLSIKMKKEKSITRHIRKSL